MPTLVTESRIHIQDPTKIGQRYLVTGTVLSGGGGNIELDFPDARFQMSEKGEILVFFEEKRKFWQQKARIITLDNPLKGLRFDVEMVGDPCSAENREHYRISTVSSDISTVINGEIGCRMVDLSATGFGMISKHRYPVGKTLQAGLMHEGEALNGAMTVQSVRDLGPLGIRYGLRYSEAESTNSALRKGLQEVSRRVEREMLRRRSGL